MSNQLLMEKDRTEFERVKMPYVGLNPYTVAETAFFFGRDQETEIITANLVAARLTLLYGASGVGKSSVLQAGVISNLRAIAQREIETTGAPEFVVVYFKSWRDEPVSELLNTVADTIHGILPAVELDPPSTLLETLRAWAKQVDAQLLIILDQFEEYFTYHPNEDGSGTFTQEFPRALKDTDLRVNFLLSFREDALAQLDRFKGHIPNLFKNILRVKHLDLDAGRDAIRGPIETYNRLYSADLPSMKIEDGLVDAVLDQVRVGQVIVGETGRGELNQGNDEIRIETPYLQLVLTRLWERERASNSNLLQLKTLQELGGAEKIVRAHLQRAFDSLTFSQQAIAASVFDRLVTPSGAKIAQRPQDLARYARVTEDELNVVLKILSSGQNRILRPVPPAADQPDVPRFEIFHDVLAGAILELRARYEKEELEHMRSFRLRLIVLGAVFLVIVFAVLAFIAVEQSLVAGEQAINSRKLVTANQTLIAAVSAVGTESAKNASTPNATIAPTLNALKETAVAAVTSVATLNPPITVTPTITPSSIPTETTSPNDGAALLLVGAGDFGMGNNDDVLDEKPERKVYLNTFLIDKYLVTNARYKMCVEQRACKPHPDNSSEKRERYYDNSQFANYPVVRVSWEDAKTYCKWAGRRLPTEAEWEKAARGTDRQIYPWGNFFTPQLLNSLESQIGDTTPVNQYPMGASPYGALDMSGNVKQWVADWYGPYDTSNTQNPTGLTSGAFKVLRGSAFYDDALNSRTTLRVYTEPTNNGPNIGFRCAMAAPPEQFIRDYFDAINEHEYDRAWNMLSDNFKQKRHNNEFEGYRGFWETVSSVSVESVVITSQTPSVAKVMSTLRFSYTDGRIGSYEIAFDLILDSVAGVWRIDS